MGNYPPQPGRNIERQYPLREARISNAREALESPEYPKINVTIFFSRHSSVKDLMGFEKELEKCDIFMPEYSGWDANMKNMWQGVADGTVEPKDVVDEVDEYECGRLGLLNNKKKKVVFADVPYENPLWSRELSLDENRIDLKKELDSIIKQISSEANSIAENIRQRELFIGEQLFLQTKEVLDQTPSLKGKEQVNILMDLGVNHKSIVDLLQINDFSPTTVQTSQRPQILKWVATMINSYVRQADVSKEVLARAAFEILCRQNPALMRKLAMEVLPGSPTEESKDIISTLNYSEIEDVFFRINRGEDFYKVAAGIMDSHKI